MNPAMYAQKYPTARIHHTAIIDDDVELGDHVQVWAWSHIRAGAKIGRHTVIGERVSIGPKVAIGNWCKIQNNADIHEGVCICDYVFIGPGVRTTNDIAPRALGDWEDRFRSTHIMSHASIGAGATILCGIILGEGCMVGAGSTVTKPVKAGWLVVGNPAHHTRQLPDWPAIKGKEPKE